MRQSHFLKRKEVSMRNNLKINKINRRTVSRLIAWLTIFLLCIICSGVVWNNINNINHSEDTISACILGDTPISLSPGGVLKQEFVIRGRIGGLWSKLHMEIFAQDTYQGSVSIRLLSVENDQELMRADLTESQLRNKSSFTVESEYELFMQSGKYFVIEIIFPFLVDEFSIIKFTSFSTVFLLYSKSLSIKNW